MVAGIIASLALVEVDDNVHDNEGIDDFLYFARAAMHVAVAKQCIARGWTPGGPS